MILDQIENAGRYLPLHPGFEAAFDWLRKQHHATLPEGRNEIDGDRLYASVMREQGRGQVQARFETHRQYIDIQYIAEGFDLMGWRQLDAGMKGQGYDAARDLEFFDDRPAIWIPVPAGCFAVFFPEDAHAPMACTQSMTKIVMKVKA